MMRKCYYLLTAPLLFLLLACDGGQLPRTEAEQALMLCMEQDATASTAANDSLLRKAYAYFKEHPTDTLYARAHYCMGVHYSLLDSTKQAEDCLRKAIQAAEENEQADILYLSLDRLGTCTRASNPHYALRLHLRALDVYKSAGTTDFRNETLLLEGIALDHILCGAQDSAIRYLNRAYDFARHLNDSALISAVLQSKANLYYCFDDAPTALLNAKHAMEFAQTDDIGLACTLANCYAKTDSTQQAILLYTRIAREGEPGHRYQAFKELSAIVAHKYGTEAGVMQAYLDSAYSNMEKMYLHSLHTKDAYYQQTMTLQQEQFDQKRFETRRQMAYGLVIALLIVVSILAVSLMAIRHEKAKRQMHLLAERHRLQTDFDRQQHELALVQRDNKIALMRKYILARFDLRKEMLTLTSHDRHIRLTDELWHELEMFLQATDADFLPRLRATHPGLRPKDYQFCMLVRMGFPIKDLALIYSISVESMKQKLFDYKMLLLKEKDKPSFRQYIMNF